MNIFDDSNYEVFKNTFMNISSQFDAVMGVFNNDLYAYSNSTDDPYNLPVEIQPVIDFVSVNYLALAAQVDVIFKSIRDMEYNLEVFPNYYKLLEEVSFNIDSDNEESKTKLIAVVLMFIKKNSKSDVIRTIHAILKSMCVQPTVGALVSVSTEVIEQSITMDLDNGV